MDHIKSHHIVRFCEFFEIFVDEIRDKSRNFSSIAIMNSEKGFSPSIFDHLLSEDIFSILFVSRYLAIIQCVQKQIQRVLNDKGIRIRIEEDGEHDMYYVNLFVVLEDRLRFMLDSHISEDNQSLLSDFRIFRV